MTATVHLPANTWTLVVPAAKTWCLVSTRGVEVAFARTAADDTAPDADEEGHRLVRGDGITRALLQDGAIWARPVGGASAVPVDTN